MTLDLAATRPRCVDQISTMGTVVSIDVRGSCSRADFDLAVVAVTARLHAIDELYSPWRPDSWVSRLLDARARLADCPPEVQRVVQISVSSMELCEGYFSPFWRGPRRATGPDPTGLVKGWAAQEASDVLLAHGLPDHVVNAAGDLVVSGVPDPDGATHTPWRVGISGLLGPTFLVGTMELHATTSRWAVATSGRAEQGFHIHDPFTGRPATTISSATALAAVTATNDGGATVDACATALVAAGHEATGLLERLRRHDVRALLVNGEGAIHDPWTLLRSG